MANENKLQNIISASLENIRSMLDANTVIGNPYDANGTTIIPVSKISMGFASGGLDYNGTKSQGNNGNPQNFGGGGGTGLSVSPVGFLVIGKTGSVEFINVSDNTPSTTMDKVADIIERSPDIIAKIKSLFKKDGSDDDATEIEGDGKDDGEKAEKDE